MSDLHSQHKNPGVMKELLVFAAALVAFNLPLAGGRFAESMIFLPDRVMAGEWWRVLSHPLVHLTWYHFLLDAGAFLLLYGGMEEPKRLKRIAWVLACAIGSLTVSLLASPTVRARGLCGLSGVAHGLMAISALESVKSDALGGRLSRTGMIGFGVVVIKSIIEVLSGHVFFESFHFGMMGLPVPASHAGGVLSGIIAFLVFDGKPATNCEAGARRRICLLQPRPPGSIGVGATESLRADCFIHPRVRKYPRLPFAERVSNKHLNSVTPAKAGVQITLKSRRGGPAGFRLSPE
jgi:rhomboid family GlyGly-CTERM serine protease